MDDIWRDVKMVVEAVWVIFLGIVGTIAHNWDTIVARMAAFTALVLLLHTAYRRFIKKEKTKTKDDYIL